MNYKRLTIESVKYLAGFTLALIMLGSFIILQMLSFTPAAASAQTSVDSNLIKARNVLDQAIMHQQENPTTKRTKAAKRAFKAYEAVVRARIAEIEPELEALKRRLKKGENQHKDRIDELEAEIIELTISVAEARYKLATKGSVSISADPTSCVENFDNAIPPTLPVDWAAALSGDACPDGTSAPWSTVNTNSDTPPNSAFAPGPNCVNDNVLDSLAFEIQSLTAQLSFQNQFNLEDGFDGTVLEISIGGGPFQDIIDAGGSFVIGGYTSTISPDFQSPIGARQAWSGNSGGFITTTVNLPPSANGQSIRLRWRTATDSSVSDSGQFIDNIMINGCQDCSLSCPSAIIVPNTPGQCGAVVNYPAPVADGNCGTVTCIPASGSFFPSGITTVNCSSATGYDCSFTVRVNDTQAPTINCPSNVTAKTPSPNSNSGVVTYATPTATDNCPSPTVVCNPPSGAVFTVGTTTVTCTATDSSGNTSICTFKVTVFDICLQDETSPDRVVLANSFTGDYVFCCATQQFTGKGTVNKTGGQITISHARSPNGQVTIKVNTTSKSGTATMQGQSGCSITDPNYRNNSCNCNAP